MNFIITKLVNPINKHITWRVSPADNFFTTLLVLKPHDLKDLLQQIIDQDIPIARFLKYLLQQCP